MVCIERDVDKVRKEKWRRRVRLNEACCRSVHSLGECDLQTFFSLQDCKSHDWAASDCIWFLICFASCVFLQFNKLSLENANPRGHPTRKQFVAGDVRINEAIGLVTLATLFLREHNYQARLYRIQQRRLRRYVSSNGFGIVDHRSFFLTAERLN